jgi:hypothetical protein
MTEDLPTGSHLSIDTYPYVAIFGFQEDHSSSYRVTNTCAFKSFSRFLISFPRRISLWRDRFQVFLGKNRGIDFPRTDSKSELIQYIYIYTNLSINIIHTWSFQQKHATTISDQTPHRQSYTETLHDFTAYEHKSQNIHFHIQDEKHLSENTRSDATAERGARFHPTVGSMTPNRFITSHRRAETTML